MKTLYFSTSRPEDNQLKNYIRLNLNESSLDLPGELKKKILENLKKLPWNRYPDEASPELRQALAGYCKVKKENILLGNGSNDLIQNIIRAFGCSRPIILFKPSFSIYAREARIQQANYLEITIQPGQGYQAGSWLKNLSSAGLIFLDSPNNPLGCTINSNFLRTVLDNIRGIAVVDEAYAEFADRSYCSWVGRHKNLIILRTFSKAFRLAGARFGYLVASEELVNQVRRVQLPFSVGIFQQVAALTVLNQKYLILNQAARTRKERQRLFNRLQTFKHFEPLPSKANFILVRSRNFPAAEVYNFLRKKGILVRIFDLPELSHFFRVTVGTTRENNCFLDALETLEKEI